MGMVGGASHATEVRRLFGGRLVPETMQRLIA